MGAAAVSGQEGSLQIVADTDTAVPGLPGATFSSFGQLDGVDPAISGRNVVFGAFPTGIYGWLDGELRVIANLSSTFPGTGNPLGFDLFFGSSPSISGQNVAFACRNGRPGPGAICAYINGQLESIALSAVTLVPGSTETFGTFFMLDGASPSISGRNVAFVGSSASLNGVYARIDGELVTIADNNTPVPGQPGLTFLNFGQLSGASPSISGANVAFFGVWSGGGGVYARINDELRLIADTTTTGIGGVNPSISGENVAFLGSAGIYGYINGKLRVIADANTQIPGSNLVFTGFPINPTISGENVAFVAGADDLGVTVIGIFASIADGIEIVASERTVVPGHDDTTFSGFFWVDGVRPAISEENVVFTARGRLPGQQKQFVTGVYARIVDPEIPTISRWGVVLLALPVVLAAAILIRRRLTVSAK
ncbi:MAG: hypothetical protein ACE5EX_02825 [Phycisphaerae bacterium]